MLVVTSLSLLQALSTFKLEPWGDHSIRVQIAPPGVKTLTPPPISALSAVAPPSRSSISTTSSSAESLTNGNLHVQIDPTNGFVTATRISDNVVVLQQTGLRWGPATPGSTAGAVSLAASFAGDASEQVYGLGEHADGKVQRMPHRKVFADSLYYGKSHGSDVSVPWYSSSKGYGFIWNTPSLGSVELNSTSLEWISIATFGVDFWITTTPGNAVSTPTHSFHKDLLLHLADAGGHAMPMPFWTTGFIQCKDRYRNQTQLLSVARGYVERGLPISMIVIDWFHWSNMGDWELNPHCWHDPQGMVDELRGLGIELMITVWPFQGMPYPNGTVTSKHWEEFASKGYLLTNTSSGNPDSFWEYSTPTGNAVVDATNPEAMKSVWQHWQEGYGKYGVKAIWMDESEPDHHLYIDGGQWQLHKGLDAEVLPGWVLGWAEGFYNGFQERGDGEDFFILSRNAWARTAHHGAALWSGDIGSDWNSFELAVKAGQGVGMSGIPLWTTDIGGVRDLCVCVCV